MKYTEEKLHICDHTNTTRVAFTVTTFRLNHYWRMLYKKILSVLFKMSCYCLFICTFSYFCFYTICCVFFADLLMCLFTYSVSIFSMHKCAKNFNRYPGFL